MVELVIFDDALKRLARGSRVKETKGYDGRADGSPAGEAVAGLRIG